MYWGYVKINDWITYEDELGIWKAGEGTALKQLQGISKVSVFCLGYELFVCLKYKKGNFNRQYPRVFIT
jgi:hypothetical protein